MHCAAFPQKAECLLCAHSLDGLRQGYAPQVQRWKDLTADAHALNTKKRRFLEELADVLANSVHKLEDQVTPYVEHTELRGRAKVCIVRSLITEVTVNSDSANDADAHHMCTGV